MANTVPNTPTLSDPQASAPGVVLRNDFISDIGESLNHAMAYACTGQVWQQDWPDGSCSRTSATEATVTHKLRVPVITGRHTTLSVRAIMSGNGTIARVKAEDSGDAAVLNGPAVGTAIVGPVSLTISDAGLGFDQISLTLQGTGAIACTVYKIMVSVDPLSSPLAAGQFAGCTPIGLGTTVNADQALPSSRGEEIIDTLESVFARPRVHYAWSALVDGQLDDTVLGTMYSWGVETYSYGNGRPDDANETKAWVYVEGIDGGRFAVDDWSQLVNVPAAEPLTMYEFDDRRSYVFDRFEPVSGDFNIIRTMPRDINGNIPSRGDMLIYSMSVYGP